MGKMRKKVILGAKKRLKNRVLDGTGINESNNNSAG